MIKICAAVAAFLLAFAAPVLAAVSPFQTAHYDSRTALAAVSTSNFASGDPAFLEEGGRSGMFQWSTANLSAAVTADPQQCLYVAPAAHTSGSSGAWVRVLDGPTIEMPWCGAIPNDGSDDTTGVRAAMAAATGKTLHVPAGAWQVNATSGTEVLLWDQPMKIVGDGFQSQIIIGPTTPDTVDGIRIDPNSALSGTALRGWSIDDIAIVGSISGQHGVHIDLDDTAAEFLAEFRMHHVYITGFTKRAFSFNKGTDGGTPTNINGIFTSEISECIFAGGASADRVVSLDNSGDSLVFRHSIVTGTGIGIYTRPVTGAAQQIYEDNNITASGGAMYIKNGLQVKVRNGQFEQSVAYTGSDDAQIVVDDSSEVEINGVNLNSHSLVSNVLFKGTTTRSSVIGSYMDASTAASKFHAVFSSGSSRNTLLRNTYMNVGSLLIQPRVSNSSTTSTQPFGQKNVSNANYTILPEDITVSTAGTNSAARTWTLPLSTAVGADKIVWVRDLAGGVSKAFPLIMAVQGGDTLLGYATGTFQLDHALDWAFFTTNGAGLWFPHRGILEADDVFVTAASVSATANNFNWLFSNEGATSEVNITLPSAVRDLRYRGCVQDVDGLQFTAVGNDVIHLGGSASAAAGNVDSATVGSCLDLVAINAVDWVAVSQTGTWAAH